MFVNDFATLAVVLVNVPATFAVVFNNPLVRGIAELAIVEAALAAVDAAAPTIEPAADATPPTNEPTNPLSCGTVSIY